MRSVIMLLMLLFTFAIFSADVKIPVQGFLTDKDGKAINEEKQVKFTLFNTSEEGELIWTETAIINTEKGMFSYLLGTTEFIESKLLENERALFLEIAVGEEILLPRIEIGVEPKAVYSYNSGKLEGKTLDEVKTEVTGEITSDKIDDILSRLESLESAKETLESKVTTLETKVTTLQTENTTLNTKVTTLENKTATLESVNNQQNDKIATLETRINNISTFDGSYNSLTDKPDLFSGNYNDLLGKPDFTNWDTNVNDDFDGNYNNLTDLPELFNGNYNNLTDKPDLFSGNYNDLTEKPDFQTSLTALENKTANMSVLVYNGQPTVRFTGVNVQIVSGS